MKAAGASEEMIEQVTTLTEPKLITLEEASETFRIPVPTLHSWRYRGHLADKGKARQKGGGVLVDENDVRYLVEHPPKPGRPFKYR